MEQISSFKSSPYGKEAKYFMSMWYTVITHTCLFKYIENFTTKNWKFLDKKNKIKKIDICHTSAQNEDYGYSLEPPRRGVLTSTRNLCFWAEIRKIIYIPVNSSFTL